MSEETFEEEVVSRKLAIALGIICVILAVGIVGAVVNYTSVISGKDDTIAARDSTIAIKNSQISDLNNTVNLAKSAVWVNHQTINQPANYYTYWTGTASYAGYVSVNVESSTTTNTYVEVVWYAKGVSYDNKVTVGASGTAVFPVLPASIEVRVGTTDLIDGATETVTITYHY